MHTPPRHAGRWAWLASGFLFVLAASNLGGAADQTAQQKPPSFRSRVDLVQMDVAVLDRRGKPVRGLTADDFTLFEDGKPKKIEVFTAIDLEDEAVKAPESPAWARTASADVTSNEIESKRVFVLVLDDAMMMGSSRAPTWSIREMRKQAAQFLESLGPTDQAAIIFTNQTKFNQNLTADRAKLFRAIAGYPDLDGAVKMPMSCLAQLYQVRTIEAVVRELAPLTDRRKAIVYFGGNLVLGCPDSPVAWIWKDVFALAQEHHVTINPVDTQGLRVPSGDGAVYRTVAGNTGGYPVVMSNDFAPGLRQVLVRNGSYYLIAHQRPPDDGRFRRWNVKVNRPDIEVITRRLYESPSPEPDGKRPPEPPADVAALAGVVPDSTLPLRATAAAFAKADGGATVALTVGIRQPPLSARTPEAVDVIIRAFTADGDPKGAESTTIPLALPAARAGADTSRYDVLARIDVDKPGKYEVRLSVGSEMSATRGSVYVDVDVPDFHEAPVSMSGLLVSAFPSPGAVAPARAFSEFASIAPTSERTFDATHIVTAIGRVYQGGRGDLRPVTLKTSVRDAKNAVVNEQTLTIAATAFGEDRSTPLELRIPIAGLTAGQHLFSVEAVGTKTPVRRDVVFAIR